MPPPIKNSEDWLFLLVAICVPYLLRTVQTVVSKRILKYIFGGNPCKECISPTKLIEGDHNTRLFTETLETEEEKAAEEKIKAFVSHYRGRLRSDFVSYKNMIDQQKEKISWTECRVAYGWSKAMTLAVGIIRLCLWHWLQPVMYFWILSIYYHRLDQLQQILAIIVAGREAFYCLLTTAGVFVKPSFLLVNMNYSEDTRRYSWNMYINTVIVFKASYIFCPEKYVLAAIIKHLLRPMIGWTNDNNTEIWTYVWAISTLIFLCDIAGIVAFIVGYFDHELPIPLAVNYAVTVVAGVYSALYIPQMICYYTYMKLSECCCAASSVEQPQQEELGNDAEDHHRSDESILQHSDDVGSNSA